MRESPDFVEFRSSHFDGVFPYSVTRRQPCSNLSKVSSDVRQHQLPTESLESRPVTSQGWPDLPLHLWGLEGPEGLAVRPALGNLLDLLDLLDPRALRHLDRLCRPCPPSHRPVHPLSARAAAMTMIVGSFFILIPSPGGKSV